MKSKYNLGLFLNPERQKNEAMKYLNQTTKEKYSKLLSNLIDCAYEIQNDEKYEQRHLDIIELGMKQPLELVFTTYSGEYASRLSYHFKDFCDIFIRLSEDSKSSIRYNAVVALLCEPANEVIQYVIEKCMNDKSGKVRAKVADVCERLELKNMIPQLENQLSCEVNSKTRKSIQFSLAMLKDGFQLCKDDYGMMTIIVKTKSGFLGTSINEEIIAQNQITEIVKYTKENGKFPRLS